MPTAHPRPAARATAARVLIGLAVVLAVLATLSSPAAAHAVVVATNPSSGQVLDEPPATVTVQFSEQVSAELGGISVLDSSGEQVDRDGGLTPSGDVLATTLPADLPAGTYVVNYRVVSADGHPVAGSVVFGIGAGTVIDESGVSDLTAGTDPGYEIAAWMARFVTYVAALLAVGLAVFLAFAHDQADDRWRLTAIVRVSTVVAGFGMVAIVALQAALATGEGVTAMTDLSTLRAALGEGLGWQAVVLIVGLAAVHLSTDTERLLVAQVLAFYGGLAATVSFAFWGHAREAPRPVVAVVADAVHTTTAAVWFGGLVGLGLTLRHRYRRRHEPEADPRSTAGMVARFSTVAGLVLLGLLASAVALSWQEVGSLDGLRTTYGRLLVSKVCAVAAVLVLAAYNRTRLVPAVERALGGTAPAVERALGGTAPAVERALGGTAPEPDRDPSAAPATPAAAAITVVDERATATAWSRLSTTVGLEAIGIVVVLAITSALVTVTPGFARTVEPVVFNQTLPAGELRANLVVTPGAVGANALHIQYLDAAGRPTDSPQTLEVQLELPERGVGPLTEAPPRAGPGHFIVDATDLPLPGTWSITLVARVSEFDLQRTTFQVPIAE